MNTIRKIVTIIASFGLGYFIGAQFGRTISNLIRGRNQNERL